MLRGSSDYSCEKRWRSYRDLCAGFGFRSALLVTRVSGTRHLDDKGYRVRRRACVWNAIAGSWFFWLAFVAHHEFICFSVCV